MSIQAGIWNYDGRPVAGDFFLRLMRPPEQFAPDGESILYRGPLGMLYRPFHTTPESALERQPYEHTSGTILTWDGRLDNRDELISQLDFDPAVVCTDVELAAAAFERWGSDSFAKLVGEWALALWDPKHRELILARDYIGVRRLFYYPKPNSIVWCTHLEPLALCGDQFTLNDKYLSGYLALWPDASLTPYRQLFSVPPGEFICARGGQLRSKSHWNFNPRQVRYKTDPEYEEHYRHLFRQAVRRRLRSDSAVLAELSGGLDSSSIVCIADDIITAEPECCPRIDTFSYFNPTEPEDHDSQYFVKVEQKRGRVGHHVQLDEFGYVFDLYSSSFVASPGLGLDESLKVGQSQILKTGKYRILLSGTGGDEMLGQALDPRIQIADSLRALDLKQMTRLLIAWSLLLRRPLVELLTDSVKMLLPVSVRSHVTTTAKTDGWVDKRFARRHKLAARQLDAAEGRWLWAPSVRDSFQTVKMLGRQFSQCRPTIHETRYPYLDQTLVEFLLGIPRDQLLRPGQRRSLMRRALADFLPGEILNRQAKSRTGRCFVVALNRDWKKLDATLQSLYIAQLGYADQTLFREALERIRNGDLSFNFLRALKALSWELWFREAKHRRVVNFSSAVAHN